MRIDVLTIFPEMFPPVLESSILARAAAKKVLRVRVHDLRDWSNDKHRKVDDRPYGGGPGMVMRAEPFFLAVEEIRKRYDVPKDCSVRRTGFRCLISFPTVPGSPRGPAVGVW